jgi:hypothetical protein
MKSVKKLFLFLVVFSLSVGLVSTPAFAQTPNDNSNKVLTGAGTGSFNVGAIYPIGLNPSIAVGHFN